jgi:SAM-dependent methyltransferase
MTANFWDNRYGEEGFAYGEAPNDFLRSVLERLPPGDALCLAEGEGRNAVYLAQHGYTVTAVDQSAVGLEKARALAATKEVTVETITADLEHFEMAPGRWDVVLAVWCHLPPALRKKVHAAAVTALRPGGALVLEAYTPDQLTYKTGGPPNAELMPTLADLKADFAGLDLEHAVELVREVQEGRYHSGMSAVVQVLGFKRA